MAKFGFVSKNKGDEQEPPAWMKKLMNAAGRAWNSAGSMNVDFEECSGHWHMTVSPALREFAGGGEHDGEQFFAKFDFSLPRFMRAFDKAPKILFRSGNYGEAPPGLDIRGSVLGVVVYVAVFGMPFPGQPVTEVAYVTGPKEGMVEPRYPSHDDEDSDDD